MSLFEFREVFALVFTLLSLTSIGAHIAIFAVGFAYSIMVESLIIFAEYLLLLLL